MTDARIQGMRDYWNQHAATDPMWAIVSDESKRQRRWKLEEFLETGEREISLLWHELRQKGLLKEQMRHALDFGCGIGRLTQPLGDRVDHVVGVDVSDRMIEIARAICRRDNVTFLASDDPSVSVRPSETFDLIYSNIVLQHVAPDLAVKYIASFCRRLSPGGLLIFQLPSHHAEPAAQPAPMPDAAYRVKIHAVVPRALREGESFPIDVTVTNLSSIAWDQSAFGALRIGNHWRDSHGKMLVQDDGRTVLPDVLPAGGSCAIRLDVSAPDESGRFLLEMDAVHEAITWFGDRGSEVFTGDVTVGAASTTAAATSPRSSTKKPVVDTAAVERFLDPSAATDAPPPFPMYAIQYDEVVQMLTDGGLSLRDAREDDHAKPEWVSYRYIGQRPD